MMYNDGELFFAQNNHRTKMKSKECTGNFNYNELVAKKNQAHGISILSTGNKLSQFR